MSQTDYIHKQEMGHLLAALTPSNRLALEISMATGLRIGDVLALRADDVRSSADGRISVRELKTGKRLRIKLAQDLQRRAIALSGKVYVFEGRLDWRKPRTRQAVFADLKRAAKMFRCTANIAPHSARKVFAVDAFKRSGGDLKRVQRLLNHSRESVTMLYALADELTARRLEPRRKGKIVP